MDPSFALVVLGVLLHTGGADAFHVVSEVGVALLGVAVGIATAVGAFTLFHEWLTATR